MSVSQDRLAIGTVQARYLAALAVVSNGRPLEADQRAVFTALMNAEDLAVSVRDALLLQAAGGVEAADVPALERHDRQAAVLFLVALTRLALAVGGDRPEPLTVPEYLAPSGGVPRGFVARAALKLGSQPEGELRAQLEAFFYPGQETRDLAEALAASLAPPRAPRRSFARVSPARYRHPQDTTATELMKGIAGLDDVISFFFKYGLERVMRIMYLSDAVEVNERQFPELYHQYLDCVARVGVHPVPALYVKGGALNAHTSGIDRPYIVLNAGAVASLSREELDYIIGHELGHIRCEHMLYLVIGQIIPFMAQLIPIAGRYISQALYAAMANWSRMAEFSCDRVGLLTCQDPDAAYRAMIKLSGIPASMYPDINLESYLEQNREFEELDKDTLSMVYKFLMNMDRSHPWTVSRVAEIKRWHDEGHYAAILADGAPNAGEAPQFLPLASLPAMAFRCSVCGTTYSLAARECPQCGAPPRDVDRVRRCASCGETCDTEAVYCAGCQDPAARRARLAPQAALEGPPAERLRAVLGRLRPAVAKLGLGPLADEPLAVLAEPGSHGHLTVVVGERGRGQQALAALVGAPPAAPGQPPTLVETAPALDTGLKPDAPQGRGPEAVVAAALLPADLVLVSLDAHQLLAREEREAIRERVLPYAVGEVALVVMHMGTVEDAEDRKDLRERALKFAERCGREGLQVFFPGDPDDAEATARLSAFVAGARGRGLERRDALWLKKTSALLNALGGMLEGDGAWAGGWREATAEERAEMQHALRQEHALALVQAEAVLSARFAALRGGLATRLDALSVHQLQHEGLGELVAEVQAVGHEAGRSYLESFERGLLARAPQPLRRAAEGFKQHAEGHLDRDLAGSDPGVTVNARRNRNLMLMALTAVGTGLLIFSGGMLPVVGALSLAGAHGLRLEVDERHAGEVRSRIRQTVEAWATEVELTLREQLRTSAELVFEALNARVEAAMAAPIVQVDAPVESAHAVLALVRQGQALHDEAVQREEQA